VEREGKRNKEEKNNKRKGMLDRTRFRIREEENRIEKYNRE